MSVSLDAIQILQLITEDESPETVAKLAKKIVERYPQKAEMLLRKMSLEKEFNDSFITVTSAHDLTAAQKKLIENILSHKSNSKVEVTYLINEDLLGGVIIRRGEDVIDNTLRGRLEQLTEQVRGTKFGITGAQNAN